ncbi:MAG: DUF4297 domain-containing protein [Bacteroidetes bacterium]|nr:DUF4297 domain-containing protein [Bacteroidota bacterium]
MNIEDNSNNSPESELNSSDHGDDVQRRFRYQNTYAGILGILMTDESKSIAEIFCEHHDDILVKDNDQKYTGIQIKTKDINSHPFDIGDEAIQKSFKRFVEMDLKFPNQFKGFSVISNHGFDKTSTASCIQSMIDYYMAGGQSNGKTNFGKFVKSISEQCGCSVEEVITTIKKIKLISYSSLDDIHIKLANSIKCCPRLAGITESKLNDIADIILSKFFKASSLHQDNNDSSVLFVAGTIGLSELQKELIDSKKFTRPDFIRWLEQYKEEPVQIKLKDRNKIDDIPSGSQVLSIKMDAGEIDMDNIDMLRDLKFSFEQHALTWLYKDSAKANEQYNQVTKITENLCREIFDENKIATTNDGLGMLVKVRKAIKERQEKNPELFFDCTYEHLLGVVAVLTESCKVWWSEKFDLMS